MKEYLIVTDLDGTLLNSNHEVSQTNLKWIEHFKERDGLFTIATGRMNKSVKRYINKMNITLPVITYNGAQIYCPVKNEVLYERSLTLTDAMHQEIISVAKSYGAELLYFSGNEVFSTDKGELTKRFEQIENMTCELVQVDQIPEKVTKIIVMSRDAIKLDACKTTFQTHFEKDIDLVYSEPEYLEILPKHVSKGEALRVLKERRAFTDHYTVGFGNNLNDVSLLQAADLGVAVKNSVEGLIQVADEVASYTNNEDVVGRYIESLVSTPSAGPFDPIK